MFLKSKQNLKYFLIITILGVFFLGTGKLYASSEPLNVCGNAGANPFSFPNHMATSCNTSSSQYSVSVPLHVISDTNGVETLKGRGTYAFNVTVNGIGLLNYFNSINSNGTTFNGGYGNPYTPFGYMVEKMGIDPYVNFSALAKGVSGLGGFNVNTGSFSLKTANSSGTVNITAPAQSSSVGVVFFPVPTLGTAADLFTLGSSFILNNQYNPLQLPNNSVVGSVPSQQFDTSNSQALKSNCASSSNNSSGLTCKLLAPYGSPYNPTSSNSNTVGGYVQSNGGLSILTDIVNFFGNIFSSITNIFSSSAIGAPSVKGGYCPTKQQNNTDTSSSTSVNQSNSFSINVSETCNSKVGSCPNTYTDTFSPNLYLQGLNRILADEWYMEASLNQGPPIGHTNLKAWSEYVNPNTDYLYSGVLSAMQNNGTYNGKSAQQIEANLFDGIGINANVSASIVSPSGSSVACLSTGASSTTGSPVVNSNYEFPWLGDAPIIQQNLDIHKFQPYFANSASTSSNSGTNAPLPKGEYYIKDRSQFPDPLLLYLVYVGALSSNDPVVAANLGSYNPFACTQGSSSNGASSGTGGANSSFSQSACLKVLNSKPSTPNYSSSHIISDAEKFIGGKYQETNPVSCTPYGGQGNGIDCSGLTQAVYRASGFNNIGRTTFAQFQSSSLHIFYNASHVVPGDLIYYYVAGDGPGVGHVGIVKTWNGTNNYTDIEASDPQQGIHVVTDTNIPVCYDYNPGTAYSFVGSSGYCIAGYARPAGGQLH